MFRRLQNNATCFVYKQYVYQQNQVEIRFDIIIIILVAKWA